MYIALPSPIYISWHGNRKQHLELAAKETRVVCPPLPRSSAFPSESYIYVPYNLISSLHCLHLPNLLSLSPNPLLLMISLLSRTVHSQISLFLCIFPPTVHCQFSLSLSFLYCPVSFTISLSLNHISYTVQEPKAIQGLCGVLQTVAAVPGKVKVGICCLQNVPRGTVYRTVRIVCSVCVHEIVC